MHLIVSFKVASIKYDSSNRNDDPLLMKVVKSLSMRWIEIDCTLSKRNRDIQHRSVLQKDSIETQHQKAINDIINMTYGKDS